MLGMTVMLAGCAEFRGTGREIKETGRDVGHEVRDAAVEVGHESKKAAKKLGKATEEAVHDVHEDLKK